MRRLLKRHGLQILPVVISLVGNVATGDLTKAPATSVALMLACVGWIMVWESYNEAREKVTLLEEQVKAIKNVRPISVAENGPVDKDNHYTLIKAFAHIDTDGNYQGRYERYGVNQSKTAIDHLRVLTCADSYLEFSRLKVQANDLNGDKPPLKVEAIQDNPGEKLFKIYFRSPVQPGGSFAVGWSFVWPGVMRDTTDEDFVFLNNFERGVEQLVYTLEFERKLSTWQFEKKTNTQWEIMEEGEETQQGNCWVYSLDVNRKLCDGYKFSYRG
jgi:hypothetical protein